MTNRPPENWENYFAWLKACIGNIGSWVISNLLKLNQYKTELIIFTTKQNQKSVPSLQLKVGDRTIRRVMFKNLLELK